MQFSKFGEKFNRYSGITRLMDDLNDGLRTPGAIMLSGGNPAAIPTMLGAPTKPVPTCSPVENSLPPSPTTMVCDQRQLH